MVFSAHILKAFISLIAIIYTCSLFTNAIEHLGERLKLGNNAVGSILAVIGTSLPETIVPLVAIFGAYLFKTDIKTGQNIATGAIIGSPFMLSTLALFLMGVVLFGLYVFKKRDKKELNLDYKIIIRDYKYFLSAYSIAILAGFIENNYIKYFIVFILLGLYFIFVYRTIIKSRQNFTECLLDKLIFEKIFKNSSIFMVILQIFVSLICLILFSHLFVSEIKYFAGVYNLSPLILSLIVTPFATELPECINSIIWIKNNKDDLAIANVLGAIVFQAMIPCSIGILLTSWKFCPVIFINAILVFICSIIFILSSLIAKKVKLLPLLACGLFYFGFLIYIFI